MAGEAGARPSPLSSDGPLLCGGLVLGGGQQPGFSRRVGAAHAKLVLLGPLLSPNRGQDRRGRTGLGRHQSKTVPPPTSLVAVAAVHSRIGRRDLGVPLQPFRVAWPEAVPSHGRRRLCRCARRPGSVRRYPSAGLHRLRIRAGRYTAEVAGDGTRCGIRQLERDHERPGSWRLSRCSHETASRPHACRPEQLQDELERVRDDFREAGIDAKPIVAYPFGSENVRVRAASRDAGYRLGYTIDAGANGAGTDPFRLHRVMVLSSDGLLTVLWKALTEERPAPIKRWRRRRNARERFSVSR